MWFSLPRLQMRTFSIGKAGYATLYPRTHSCAPERDSFIPYESFEFSRFNEPVASILGALSEDVVVYGFKAWGVEPF